jgi:hypothetical protein
MWFAWTSGRALRAGEDLDIAALPVQTGAAHSPPVGCSPRPRCWRTARSRGSPPPVAGGRRGPFAAGGTLGGRGRGFVRPAVRIFLVDFVPLLSRADDVVLMAMNMRPFPPNWVEVTRWRRPRFSPGDTGCGSGRARCAGTALWAGAMPPPSPRSKQDHCAEDGVNSVNPTRCWRRRPGSRSIQR